MTHDDKMDALIGYNNTLEMIIIDTLRYIQEEHVEDITHLLENVVAMIHSANDTKKYIIDVSDDINEMIKDIGCK